MSKYKNEAINIYKVENDTNMPLPFADAGIKAGFTSLAQDLLSEVLDLNEELIHHPAATFYGRVSGDSMKDAGLTDGDILVIDKSLEPRNGDMAVCYVDGDFTVKYIRIESDSIWLIPANDSFMPILVTEENDFLIWGIVTYSIRRHRRK